MSCLLHKTSVYRCQKTDDLANSVLIVFRFYTGQHYRLAIIKLLSYLMIEKYAAFFYLTIVLIPMKITRTIIWTWLVLFLPFFTFKLYKSFQENEKYENAYNGFLSNYIGSKFTLKNFVNSSGQDASIDVSNSKMTVVDFWFKECPPCLTDMKHYSELIQGREKQINVFTISINRYDIWKPLLHSSKMSFSMLSKPIPNWTHLALKSNEDPKLGNSIPAENLALLQNTFQSTNFPMYFVLDRNGIIKATPFSLSKYIELNVLEGDPFWYFFTDRATWTADYSFVPTAFVEYSGYFWIATILLLITSRLRGK